MGTVIPFDGSVIDGEAMVNQASLTGESVPVCKKEGSHCLCRNCRGGRRDHDPRENSRVAPAAMIRSLP